MFVFVLFYFVLFFIFCFIIFIFLVYIDFIMYMPLFYVCVLSARHSPQFTPEDNPPRPSELLFRQVSPNPGRMGHPAPLCCWWGVGQFSIGGIWCCCLPPWHISISRDRILFPSFLCVVFQHLLSQAVLGAIRLSPSDYRRELICANFPHFPP